MRFFWQIYNLGTGTGYSVLQMVQAMEKASGKKVGPHHTSSQEPRPFAAFAHPSTIPAHPGPSCSPAPQGQVFIYSSATSS
jgi:UDP-glucose 4-epimerase